MTTSKSLMKKRIVNFLLYSLMKKQRGRYSSQIGIYALSSNISSIIWQCRCEFGAHLALIWHQLTSVNQSFGTHSAQPMSDQPELHWSRYFMKDMILLKKCCIICKRQFAFECVLRKKCANVPKMCCRWEAAKALVMHPALWEIKGFLVRLCSRNCTVEWWHQTMLATCKQPHMLCVLCYAVWQFYKLE